MYTLLGLVVWLLPHAFHACPGSSPRMRSVARIDALTRLVSMYRHNCEEDLEAVGYGHDEVLRRPLDRALRQARLAGRRVVYSLCLYFFIRLPLFDGYLPCSFGADRQPGGLELD